MPLIIISGYPASGKTRRAEQIKADFEHRIALVSNSHSASDEQHQQQQRRWSQLSVSHISDDILGISRSAYASAKTEKDARAALSTAIKRALSKDVIVIADAMNNIKGFRYQLYCEAKALSTPSCVVHVGTPILKCRELNNSRLPEKQSPQKAAIKTSFAQIDDAANAHNAETSAAATTACASSASEGWDPELFENLVFRYEEPNGMTRWDKPLFTVLFDDERPPCEEIWDALIGSNGELKTVRPNQATVKSSSTPPDALYLLEKVTANIVSSVSSYIADHPHEGGEIHIQGGSSGGDSVHDSAVVCLPIRVMVTTAQLQRLRRQFVAQWRAQGRETSMDRVADGFAWFLNNTWNTNED